MDGCLTEALSGGFGTDVSVRSPIANVPIAALLALVAALIVGVGYVILRQVTDKEVGYLVLVYLPLLLVVVVVNVALARDEAAMIDAETSGMGPPAISLSPRSPTDADLMA